MRSLPPLGAVSALALSLALACASSTVAHAPPVMHNAPVVQINGEWLDEMALPRKTHDRLRRLDDTYAQERLVALWAGIEDAVSDRLLAEEAARQGIPLARLLAQEVDARIGPITEAEVRALFDRHRSTILLPFAEAEASLREQARAERGRALRRALVDRLRERAQVELRLPPIALHRKAMAHTGPSLGPPQAPITLVVFSDFACPYSAQARRLVRRLSELYGNELHVVHRNFPLPQHEASEALALAGLCAEKEGKFWAFYEQAFDHEGPNHEQAVATIANAAGLDAAALDRCRADPQLRKRLADDVREGRAAGVRGTPSMFLNGMPLTGVLPLPIMQALVDQERAPSRQASRAAKGTP